MVVGKRFLTASVVVMFVVAGVVGGRALISAQEDKEGIGISPTSLTLSADPGGQLKGKLTVLNEGNQPMQYRVYASDFSIVNEEYEKNFERSPGTLSPISWIKLPSGTLELAPKTSETIEYTIDVPEDAVSRGYYGVIFAETVGTAPDATGVTRIKRVGSLVYLGIKGDLVQKGEVVSFTADKWQRQQPVTAQLRLQNDGNVHLAAEGNLRLKNILGRTVSETGISGTLLPATTRKYSLELPTNNAFGFYKVEGDVNFADKDTALSPRWVLVASPLLLAIAGAVVAIWIAALILWIKRRGRRNK